MASVHSGVVSLVLILWSMSTIGAENNPVGGPVPPMVMNGKIAALDGFGINIGYSECKPGEMKMIAEAGFRMVRVDLSWDASEWEKEKYNFAKWDRLLKAAEEYGLRVMLILAYKNHHYDEGLNPHSDEGRRAFSDWAVAAVERFKGRGVLWEMYNEPNNELFWKPRPNTQDYIKLAQVTCKAIRKAAPDEVIIGPAPAGGITWSMSFMEECFEGGLLEYFSAITVHPYRDSDPETVAGEYRQLRTLIDRYAPSGKTIPIYSGEWAYSDTGENNKLAKDVLKQARYNIRLTLTNWLCDVPVSVWYNWDDKSYGVVESKYLKGQSPPFVAKPAYEAAVVMSRQLKGFRFSKRLWTGDPDVYLALFSGPNGFRIVAWTSSTRPKEVTLPPGIWTGIDMMGQGLSAITGGKLVVQQDPVYLSGEDTEGGALAILAAWERLPAFMTVTAPQLFDLTTRAPNPGKQDIVVSQQRIAPGQSIKIGKKIPLQCDDLEMPVELAMEITGAGTWAQRSWINVLNPIQVTLVPLGGARMTVGFRYLYGPSITGTANIDGQSISFNLAETQRDLTLPFIGNVLNPVRVEVMDGKSRVVLPSSRFRLELLPDFAESFVAKYRIDGGREAISGMTVPAPDWSGQPGTPAVVIAYAFGEKRKEISIRPKGKVVYEGKPAYFGIWLCGDGQKNRAAIYFKDAAGRTYHSRKPQIVDWTGWRFLTYPLDVGHNNSWGGTAHDGGIHYPISCDTLLTITSPAGRDAAGRLHVALPCLIYKEDLLVR